MDLRRARLLTLATAFIAAFVAFLPSLQAGFVDWDDTWILVNNEAYRGFGWDQLSWMATTTHKGPYQPLSWLSYAVDHAFWGMDPFGYHLTNNLLHALAALLLAGAALRLLPRLIPELRQRPALLHAVALGAAVLWAVHPLRAESVAWATERRDVLSGALLFASFWAWIVHVERSEEGAGESETGSVSKRAYWLAVALFSLSLLAKATAMGWWVALLLLDVILRREGGVLRLVREKLPFIAVSLPIAAMAMWGQSDTGASWGTEFYGVLDRIVLAGYSTAFYVFRTVVPLDLRAHYGRPYPLVIDGPMIAGTIAVVIVSAAAIWSLRRRSVAGAAWCAYLVLLAPVCGLVVVGTHLVAERYSYQSTFPLALLAAGVTARLLLRVPAPSQRLAGAVAVLLAAALGVGTWRAAATWHSTETLFAHVLESEPDNWLAHMKVGFCKADRGEDEEARTHLYRSIELYDVKRTKSAARLAHIEFGRGDFTAAGRLADRAIRDDEENGTAWSIRARLLDRAGRLDEALTALNKALDLSERDPSTLVHLAWVHIQKRNGAAAAIALDEALMGDPDHGGGWRLRGLVLEENGDLPGAEAAYRRSSELQPESAAPIQNLAVLFQMQQRGPEAEKAFRRAIELDDSLVEARYRLADLLERSRRGVEAEALLREALARRPESGEGHFRLGQLLQRKGDLPDAEAHYRVAVERNPKVPAALGSLARVLAAQDKFREAVPFCAKACELLQNQPTPHVELGAMLERIDRKHDAERAYRHALKLAPETQPALLRLARLLVAEPSAREEAAGLFERFLEQKDDPGIRLSLAELYAHIENPQAAREHAQKAMNDAGEAGNNQIRDRAAALLASL